MLAFKYVAVALIGYLLGAIPFGIIASKAARGMDVRRKLGDGPDKR